MMDTDTENYPSKADDGVTIISSEEQDKYQERFSSARVFFEQLMSGDRGTTSKVKPHPKLKTESINQTKEFISVSHDCVQERPKIGGALKHFPIEVYINSWKSKSKRSKDR